MNQPPATPIFSCRADRIELARRRHFDEGRVPSGVVSDAVFRSWARCQRLHNAPTAAVVFEPVTASRTEFALHKNGRRLFNGNRIWRNGRMHNAARS